MSALYGRAFARDFIDIDAALRSGRYIIKLSSTSRNKLIVGFGRRVFANALGQANVLDPDDFAQYGVTGQALDNLRDRFEAWRRELLAGEDLAGADGSVL